MYKKRKFKNIKTVVDGIKFDSKKEAKRYSTLKQQEQQGLIENLVLQPKWTFPIRYVCKTRKGKEINYSADFQYYRDGVLIVEDVKSKITKEQPAYRMKIAMLEYFYNIEITEVE